MAISEKYFLAWDDVSDIDKKIVSLFREFIRDDATLNVLMLEQENTDEQLYRALIQTLESINTEFPPITNFKEFTDLPSLNMLFLGATLNILTSNGILSSRNMVTYQDAGGITVRDFDKYGRYINYFNVLINKFITAVQQWKIAQNVESAYGDGQASEYTLEY